MKVLWKFFVWTVLCFFSIVAILPEVSATRGFESRILISDTLAEKYNTVITNFTQGYLSQYDKNVVEDTDIVTAQRDKIVAVVKYWSSGIRPEYVYALEYLVYRMDLWLWMLDLLPAQEEWQESLTLSQNDVDPKDLIYTRPWDTVSVDYIWRLEDGTVFDTSIQDIALQSWTYNAQRTYTWLDFVLWAGQMIAGFDAGVMGMYIWETKTIYISAADGYGEYDINNVVYIPRSTVKDADSLVVGDVIYSGSQRLVVLEVWIETIKGDANHFLAGKDLVFEVTLLDIIH